MTSGYEEAVTTLYRAPHESFVTERQRLAAELKAEGDKAGAAQLAKLGRPSISAWAVNQLWWHAREAFDELFATAAQLRAGKLSASAAHRKAVAALGARAQKLLIEGGHSANDATLRRVTTTLSGLAAAGSFEPELPGALTKDRDPPGFEAFGIVSGSDSEEKPEHRHASGTKRASEATAPSRERETAERKRKAEAAGEVAERKRKAEAAERKREAEALAKRQARRKELESELRAAKAELAEREHERDSAAKQLTVAEREVERARSSFEAARAKFDSDRDS